ncbi:MAG: peptidase S41, partial [Flavobacteriaceae bacterium]|nr:peptidase S41 [Flavobacteriaceae bacterium]
TLYDSDDFGRQGANPNHKYAMQPLVLKLANRDGISDFSSGLTPDFAQQEFVNDLGILGDSNEPLLAIALNKIAGVTPPGRANRFDTINTFQWNFFKDSNDFYPLKKEMYLEDFKLNFLAKK